MWIFFTKPPNPQIQLNCQQVLELVLHETEIVLSSSIDPNTWTITIFANLLYSLNFSFKIKDELILIHNLVARFNSKCSPIAPLALWDIVSLKQEDFTSNICESKKRGTIIPWVLQVMFYTICGKFETTYSIKSSNM